MSRLEDLSKELDTEIRLKEEAERKDAANKRQAEAAGCWGIFSGMLKGLGYGVLIALICEIFGLKTIGGILFIIAIVVGGVAGYDYSYHSKRK